MRVVPGKLMLAGEYAVLRPHGVALAVAVGEVVRSSLTPGAPRVTMHAFEQTFELPADERIAPGLLGFAARTLAWAESHHGIQLRAHLTLHVTGAIGGAKVGLGTSAAVTVATLRAVVQSAGAHWSAARIAEAARQIHGAGQGAGSGYDVTTIAFGGCVAYQRTPDRAHHLLWPRGLVGLALFSGAPAPTQAALNKPPVATHHLDAIDDAARALIAAWSEPVPAILARLHACDDAFLAAAADDPDLLPPEILSVRARIAAHVCVARASGAGGGDCVLAFADDIDAVRALAQDWERSGGHVVAQFPNHIAPEAT